MSSSPKCAEVIERLVDLLDVWEVPVCAHDLHQACPSFSKYTCAHALKQMAEAEILYPSTDARDRDRVYYFPTAKRPVNLIQELLCKGLTGGSHEQL